MDENATQRLSPDELYDVWPMLPPDDRQTGFALLDRDDAEDFFRQVDGEDQLQILEGLGAGHRRAFARLLEPDDAADVLQAADEALRNELLGLFDERSREEIRALMAYAEDDAGGLMSTRFVRVRPDMSVDEAIRYLRKQAREKVETLSYTYVLDPHQRLLGVVSFRQLFSAPGETLVSDVMETDLVTVPEQMDQEDVGRLFAQHDLVAVPVLDAEGRMKGIVTIDDIVDVVEEEATEDIQKLGGMEALDAPYMQVDLWGMVRKRAPWLSVLMIGEMFTATAMGYFDDEIKKAVVLTLFIPTIISCGGNSGSQASTLVIRALALGEVRLRDWLRVLGRELAVGLSLGAILGVIGLARILLWPNAVDLYGPFFVQVAFAVALSIVGVVVWGSTMGAMLPLVLRSVGFDPATASAPLVATMVDVTGLIIYFTVASQILSGTLLP